MIRAILFDLDGVLIQSYEVWFELVKAAARDLVGGAVSRGDFAAGWGQGIEADVERFFPGRSVAEVERYYDAHFLDHAPHLMVNPDATPVLRELRSRGIPTVLVTNTPGTLAREILRAAELALDAVVGGTDVAHAKPAPDMIVRAAELVGVVPAEALVVGDTEFDRAAARAAGAKFAGLGIEGDYTLRHLGEVLALAPGQLSSKGRDRR
ncbi:MAG TPA: haloacid dehalogenase [Deltaproteobacteria bacterium]|jgi:phosphoglycolate phosphatase/AHBA synthesis associated protein|nr:haloacid dehalogenase [Deltaproteobacteria bacterium]